MAVARPSPQSLTGSGASTDRSVSCYVADPAVGPTISLPSAADHAHDRYYFAVGFFSGAAFGIAIAEVGTMMCA